MMDLLSDPTVKAGLALLILIVLSATAFFLVARLRDYTAQDWDSSSGALSNFEEMRLKGDISEEEFRTIQSATTASDGEEGSTSSPKHPCDDSNSDQETT